MPTLSREIRLAARPRGAPTQSDFELAEREIPTPATASSSIRNAFVSVDPYMRGRMNDVKSYVPPFAIGEPMTGGAVGQVIASRNERFAEGAWVVHDLGWREAALSDGRGMRAVDPALAPLSTTLGVLGMTGMTAFVGIVDIGDVQDGDTVFVSGAAGAVGSIAAQLARLRGARVVGSAGSPEKVAWLRELGRRRGVRLPRDEDARRPPRARARGHRRLLRQRRRRDPRGRPRRHAAPRPDRRLRVDLALQRDRGAARAAQPVPRRDEAPPDAGVHRLRPLRPVPGVPREVAPRVADGTLRYRETIVDGIERAPEAFIGMLEGANIGKMLVRVGPGP